MRFANALAKLCAAATILSSTVSALPKVTRAGRYLYSADGTRFYIKGVAYQEQGELSTDPNAPFAEPTNFFDPLADANACARDVPFLQQLGVNAIRVYSVDASNNHDACMQALESAGIYTIIDLSLPVNGSLDRSNPAWSTNLLNLYINTIDAFAKYDNVLAYNVGNEVVTSPAETVVAPFIKAAARDTKAYLRSKNLDILIGYAAINGDRTWIDPLANYLSCDSDETAIDLFGLNDYEWCGESTFAASYSNIFGHFAGYNVPAYFSEFGCNEVTPRIWQEVTAMFSEDMSPVFSGGIAFSYFPAQSDAGTFGMVTIDGDTVTTSTDFTNLATQYQAATGPNTPSQADAGSTTFPACPAVNSSFLASTTLPPTPNDAACKCMTSNLSCNFTPQTTNYSTLVGELFGPACSLLADQGGNCDNIGSSGATGTYGLVAMCSPEEKLGYVFTEFYEATNRNAASCSFQGNASVNTNAPASRTDVENAVSSCLAGETTFTPTAPSTGGNGGGNSNGGGSGNGNGNGNPNSSQSGNSAVTLGVLPVEGAIGAALMVVMSTVAGALTLL